MARRNVIVEVQSDSILSPSSFAFENTSLADSLEIPFVDLDQEFGRVPIPQFSESQDSDQTPSAAFNIASSPDYSTYIVRGTVDDAQVSELERIKEKNPEIVGIYADVRIYPMYDCPSGPVGTEADVERLLCVEKLRSRGMDGSGVVVAIVDTGIDMAYLQSKGKNPNFDVNRSWSPDPLIVPGQVPLSHGTMVAYDVCIAAPNCTLLDMAIMSSLPRRLSGQSKFDPHLTNAIQAYGRLIDIFSNEIQPDENGSFVINNSWGLYNLSDDFRVGHPLNYSASPNHPFTRQVRTLERMGADILFAAGNCGPECPDRRCSNAKQRTIYGANSAPFVISVAGVTINKDRLGYSSVGPGRLANDKPDLCGYTHFRGSGVFEQGDSGTSAACAVVSGVVAAVRSAHPYDPNDVSGTNPDFIRQLLNNTAQAIGTGAPGYDYEHGHGVVDPCAAVDQILPL